MSNQKPNQTTEELVSLLETKIWGFVVIAVTLILCFIVVAFLYSIIFVTQPIKSVSQIDQSLLKMLNDVVLLIVGGIGGIMSKKVSGAVTNAYKPPNPTNPIQPTCYANNVPNQTWTAPSGALPAFINPALDESWTPPPPPTTPPDLLEDDHEREKLAQARREAE